MSCCPEGRVIAPDQCAPLLSVSGLVRSFGWVRVLDRVDLQVGAREAVAVVGPNGSGKTTLLRCVIGADRPSAGTVELDGRPLREHETYTRRRLASLMEDVDCFGDLTVAEHLSLLLCAHGDPAPDAHAAELLMQAGLGTVADRFPVALSSGQRRRLGLAACFARPRVLVVLDEPEQRLDRAGRRWLTGLLLREKQLEHGVLIATHDHRLVRAVADRVVHLGVQS